MNMEFETERLGARAPVVADAPRITELMQDKDLPWNLGRAPWPYALSDAEAWVESNAKSRSAGEEYAFALHHAEHGLIGSTGISQVDGDIWEIGYWIGKPYWGQGYVTEAARGLLDWANHEMGINRFVSGHIFDNPASGRVLIKLGFELAGEIQMYVSGRGCEVRSLRYVRNAPMEVALRSPSWSDEAQD
ncbi:MAG: GNAT family N-acetyltransferase [Hyphomonadaceae bacterium]